MHSATATASAPRQWFDCQHGGDKSRIQIQRAMDKAEVKAQVADMIEDEADPTMGDVIPAQLCPPAPVGTLWDSGFGLYLI